MRRRSRRAAGRRRADGTIAVLTGKSVATLLAEGGSGSWLLNTTNARRQRYLLCVRNGKNKEPGSDEAHGAGFLVGKVRGLDPLAPVRGVQRWRIGISEYALVTVPDVWQGWRNPIRYGTLEEFGVHLDTDVTPVSHPGRAGAGG